MTYNLSLFKEVESVLREAEEAGGWWINPRGFAEFGVRSGLAPYLVEKPFIDDILLGLCCTPNMAAQYLTPRGHMKTWVWQAAATYILCDPPDWCGYSTRS